MIKGPALRLSETVRKFKLEDALVEALLADIETAFGLYAGDRTIQMEGAQLNDFVDFKNYLKRARDTRNPAEQKIISRAIQMGSLEYEGGPARRSRGNVPEVLRRILDAPEMRSLAESFELHDQRAPRLRMVHQRLMSARQYALTALVATIALLPESRLLGLQPVLLQAVGLASITF